MNKNELQALRNVYAIVTEDNKVLNNRLKKIEEICKQAPAIDSELSLRILEVIEGEGEE